MHRIPDWFVHRIVDGVQFLMALPLAGAPAHQPLQVTAWSWALRLWHADAGWDERRDSARLYRSFSELAARSQRWPSPEALLGCLDLRPQVDSPRPPVMASRPRIERRASMRQPALA